MLETCQFNNGAALSSPGHGENERLRVDDFRRLCHADSMVQGRPLVHRSEPEELYVTVRYTSNALTHVASTKQQDTARQ